MENRYKTIYSRINREFVPVIVVFFAVVMTVRIIEISLVVYRHGASFFSLNDVAFAFVADLQLVMLISLPVTALYAVLKRGGSFVQTLIVAVIVGLTGAAGLLLAFYYSATLTPLGPEFWAYSFNEMTDTVIAAESYLILKLVFLLAFTLLLIWTLYFMMRFIAKRSENFQSGMVVALMGATVFGTILSVYSDENHSGQSTSNKLSYFVTAGFYQPTQATAVYEPINNSEFPFLRRADQSEVLGPFFKEISEPPNIVFILIESLGGEFVGREARWGGFAPFIGSLASQGLYWENGLSMSGRTFGMIPSLLGSLPPGKHGFMELGPDYPVHTSIIRLLKDQGYHTSFFSGYNTYFDGLNYFLDYQGIDVIVNKEWISNKFGTQYDAGANYWGYDDKTLFEIATMAGDTALAEPRLEIYHSLQSHSPFTVPDEQAYARKFDARLDELVVSDSKKENLRRYRSELTTLLFTDYALRSFMDEYRDRDSYSNTIFIITGDHWLIPVPQTSRISRYHVPIIIYSDLIKEPVQFKSVNTHANITPTLTNYLRESAHISMPDSVHWIGQTMDTTRTFQNIHSLPLMKNKNQLSDYISSSYFLSDNNLYEIGNGLSLTSADDSEKKVELMEKLANFRSKNVFSTEHDRLYPQRYESQPMKAYEFITEFAPMFEEIDSAALSVDKQFQVAREYAFEGDYKRSRAISKRLLLEVPGYHDIRILMGRTYAWNSEYEKARELFREVIKRDSSYFDTYNALFDAEYWSGNYQAALGVIKTGLSHHPQSDEYLQKKIRALLAMNRISEAKETFSELKNYYPSHKKLDELKNQIN